jgi:hypothetical protein
MKGIVMSKNLALMRDIVKVYHPDDSSPAQRRRALANSSHFNVEHLVELTMAYVGRLRFVDADLYDFGDYSDCKTGSVEPVSYQGKRSFVGSVGNVMTPSGQLKCGDLRCVIYNPHDDILRYFFLPKYEWDPHLREFGVQNQRRLRFCWNSVTDRIRKWEDFECDSFEELAKERS